MDENNKDIAADIKGLDFAQAETVFKTTNWHNENNTQTIELLRRFGLNRKEIKWAIRFFVEFYSNRVSTRRV